MNEEMKAGSGPWNKVILPIPTLLAAGSGDEKGSHLPLKFFAVC